MKHIHYLYTLLFAVAALLFFALVYPHHLHYQEQYQLFLFDSAYVFDIIRQPGGVADLLGRFSTQFFLFAWVGAAIIALLLAAIQLLMLRGYTSALRFPLPPILYGLTFVPSLLLWLFLLDENALMGGPWAVLLLLLVVRAFTSLPKKHWMQGAMLVIAIPLLYWMASPWGHYYRYPAESPWLLWAAMLCVFCLLFTVYGLQKNTSKGGRHADMSSVNRQLSTVKRQPSSVNRKPSTVNNIIIPLTSYLLICAVMGPLIWKNANLKAERVMHYDFMARYQQWNRILETINREKPNNQIGVTVQNLALAMHGQLPDHLFDYRQNGLHGLLPDVGTDAISPLPTAEAFYQLGMVSIAQRTVFEAQEAILDFQKSARCYKRLAETNLISGQYKVAHKYLSALEKTLFYSQWASETMALLSNEEAIAKHPEYGRLRKMGYRDDFYFGDHVTPEMLESLYLSNRDNHLALQYLMAYYMLTGDRERYTNFMHQIEKQ